MYATRRLARVATRGLSFGSRFASTATSTSAAAPAAATAAAAPVGGAKLPIEDFAICLRNARKEAAARKAALEAAHDADLLALLRSHVKIPEVKAKLLANAAAMQPHAEAVDAEVLVPLKSLLGPKHAELHKLLPDEDGCISGTKTRQQQLSDLCGWLFVRPVPLRLFEAELAKELNCTGATVTSEVDESSSVARIVVTVSVDLGK